MDENRETENVQQKRAGTFPPCELDLWSREGGRGGCFIHEKTRKFKITYYKRTLQKDRHAESIFLGLGIR